MTDSSSRSSSGSLRARAQRLYGQALRDAGPAGVVDVDALCGAYPDVAMELRIAHESWRQVGDIYVELGREPELNRTLEVRQRLEQLGVQASLPQRMMKQLEVHAPKTSRYEVHGEVARGGMGAILKVWDSDLRRSLAMKVIKNSPEVVGGTASPEEEKPLTRFLEEAQVTSQLDHPGVVPVHELGIDDDGQVYFTMRLVRGRDLEHIIDLAQRGEEGWTRTRLLQVLLKVCEALAYAHSKGVLHRDLKPANVMVGRFGEVYVMDWGLAHVLDEDEEPSEGPRSSLSDSVDFVNTDRRDFRGADGDSIYATLDGDVIGTPSYMSPEQARGRIAELDRRSDVYSLGAILYHMLAGHLPYAPPGRRTTPLEILKGVQDGPPAPLLERAPDAPGELVAICEKAMARAPEDRYPSAVALAEDLQSFLEHRVVRAYQTGALAEIRKWIRRNRAVAAACLAVVLTTVGSLATIAWRESRSNEVLARKNEELAVATRVAEENRGRAEESARVAQERSREAEEARLAAVESAREERVQRDASRRVTEFLVDLFRSPDPGHTSGAAGDAARPVADTLSAKHLLDRGASSIEAELEDDPLLQAELMTAMGRAYLALGVYDDAEPLLSGALERRRESFDAAHRDTLASIDAVALLRRSQGRLDESEALYLEALAGAEEHLGEYDELTHATRHGLGLLRYFQGRLDEAEELLRAAYDARSVELGEEHPDTLESLGAIALLYRKQSKLDEAEELLEEILDARVLDLGEEHPDTLQAMSQLAGVRSLQGRHGEARESFARAFEARSAVLGEDHPETLVTQNDFAFLLFLDGSLREAEPVFRDALARHRRVLGGEHPFTLAVMNNLAVLLQAQGRGREARPLLDEALEASRRVNGEDHVVTVGLLNVLASVYFEQALFEEAEATYRAALDGCRRVLAPDHPNTLVVQENLVQVLRDAGKLEEAEAEARELLLATPRGDARYGARTDLLEGLRERLDAGAGSDG